MQIEILLVEDDPVWRVMLTRFINNEADLHVIHAVETKEAAVLYCADNDVDVVLMDINLSGNNLDGIQATLELSLSGSSAKVIALTSLNDESVILDAYTAGVLHYVSKGDFRKIPYVVREVMNSASSQEILVKEYKRLKEAEQYSKLTAAEKEIVMLCEAGNGRAFIMDALGKAEGTLKNQITSILRKFNVRSMKDAIRKIKSRGLDIRETDE
ncbi:response regulator [Cohnella faecalis]|uniref:DNA-binding response regulator n=1 Tax=Cohnella faecalis TaxID=2315694 RepID=A0A398CPL4_9BACL|nr:response regulator transcription factor [Cohnella faecalis]RIE05346.1 DNA-binding response regulator [Cohnella faecalis]